MCYANSGAAPVSNSGAYILVKFNLNLLTGLVGGKINKAELRFYAPAGNSGMDIAGYVTTCDWSEGNKTGPGLWGYAGDWPGLAPAAPGASGAHPNGLNTDAFQNANGTPGSGLPASWAGNQVFATPKDGVTVVTGKSIASGSGGVYLILDVTPIVQIWAGGTPNYGFFIDNTSGNYGPYLSEETTGTDLQPTLFVDYLPHGNPAPITNLTAGNPDWFTIDLTWTAPSANPPAAVASYDIRYSTSPITDDASFNLASHYTGPTPAAPGTTEHLSLQLRHCRLRCREQRIGPV